MKRTILIIFSSLLSLLESYGQCSVSSQVQQGDCYSTCQGVADAIGTGVSPFTYSWSNGDLGPLADSLCENNTYYLTMTDSIGCVAYDTLLFPPSFAFVTNTVNNASCFSCCDGTDTLTGIPSFAPPCNNNITYQWFPLDTFADTIPYRTNLCAQTYTVIISNLCDGCVYTSSATVGYNTTTTVINQMSLLQDLVLYPNPNNGDFSIEYELQAGEKGIFQIMDITGRIVAQYDLNSEENTIKIDQEVLKNGIYLYQVFSNGELKNTDKFIISK